MRLIKDHALWAVTDKEDGMHERIIARFVEEEDAVRFMETDGLATAAEAALRKIEGFMTNLEAYVPRIGAGISDAAIEAMHKYGMGAHLQTIKTLIATVGKK